MTRDESWMHELRLEFQATGGALRVILAYAGFAALWILFSDRAVVWLFSDPARIALASTIKGWFFVAVTSLLLYGLIHRLLERVQAASLRALQAQSEKSGVEHLLAAIADNSSDAIFAKDAQGRYLLDNREAARVMGKAGEPVIGLSDEALFPAGQAAGIRAYDHQVMAKGTTATHEETLSTVGRAHFPDHQGRFVRRGQAGERRVRHRPRHHRAQERRRPGAATKPDLRRAQPVQPGRRALQ